MKVLTWNVQGAFPPAGSEDRIRNQVEFIEEIADLPDLVLLNEVTTVRRELWRELLDNAGYTEIVDTLDWAHDLGESDVPPHQDFGHVNGNLAALHEKSDGHDLTRLSPSIREGQWEDSVWKDWETNFPEKILNAEFDIEGSTIELWNIRAIPGSMWGEEKIKILENTYNRIKKGDWEHCLLAGDFNSPKDELADGTLVSWGTDRGEDIRDRWITAERNILQGVEAFGLIDVFRDQHGYGDIDAVDVSWESQRFDHILASETLNPINCHYDSGGLDCSDHAPIIAEFDL